MKHKVMLEATNGSHYFSDCSCGWSGGVYRDRASAKGAHTAHVAGEELVGRVLPTLLLGESPRGMKAGN